MPVQDWEGNVCPIFFAVSYIRRRDARRGLADERGKDTHQVTQSMAAETGWSIIHVTLASLDALASPVNE
jgi:hypothetical protein